jgi:hypothetical protein
VRCRTTDFTLPPERGGTGMMAAAGMGPLGRGATHTPKREEMLRGQVRTSGPRVPKKKRFCDPWISGKGIVNLV